MTARVTPLRIPGAWSLHAEAFTDHRGSLHESLRSSEFLHATGQELVVRQANVSVSHRGVVRGIKVGTTSGRLKVVTCMRGAVLDVVVDLRPSSATFGTWQAQQLDAKTPTAVCVSAGVGHAFVALHDESTVLYLLSHEHDRRHETVISPHDPDLGIAWPADLELTLSDGDASAPTLREAHRAGVLPDIVSSCAGTPDSGPRPSTRL